MINRPQNQWGDVADSVTNALFRNYMSRPSVAEQQLMQARYDNTLSGIENDRLRTGAYVNSQAAAADKARAETQLFNQRAGAATALSETLGSMYAPETVEGPRPEERFALDVQGPPVGPMAGIQGPMPSVQQPVSQETLNERFTLNLPQIAQTAMQYAAADPQHFDEVMRAFTANFGGNTQQIANSMAGAGDDGSFTLTPGSARYDMAGNQIASQPVREANANGLSITAPDGTIIQYGGPALTKSVTGDLQSRDIELETFQTLSDNYRKALQENPGAAGVRGNVSRLADSLLGQVSQFAPNSAFAQELQGIKDNMAQGVDPVTGQPVNQDLYAPTTIARILPYSAAGAITGQSGRSLSDNDFRIVQAAVGSPEDWLSTPDKLIARLNQLDTIVLSLREKYQGRLMNSGGSVPLNSPAPAAPQAAPQAPAGGAWSADKEARYQELLRKQGGQ